MRRRCKVVGVQEAHGVRYEQLECGHLGGIVAKDRNTMGESRDCAKCIAAAKTEKVGA